MSHFCRKKIYVSVMLIAAFFIVAVLMASSINLFSLSNDSYKLEYRDLMDKINSSSVAKFLTSKDKVKLINYFYEYQKLKANISNLSYDELNRFLFLSKYLAKYIDSEYLGMSGELLNSTLGRYKELAKGEVISGNVSNLASRTKLLEQISKLKIDVGNLYDADKISKAAYQDILSKLDDIEYQVELSSFGSKELKIDLNDIVRTINKEKASYSVNADLSALNEFEADFSSVQKKINSMKYVLDFLNNGVDAIEQGDISIIGDVGTTKYEEFSAITNNIDAESLLDVVNIVEQNGTPDIGEIDFSKTMKFPNIKIDGSLEDMYRVDFDVSSLDLRNLLEPADISLMSDESLDDILKVITNAKLPSIDSEDIVGKDTLKTINPTKTSTPHTPTTTSHTWVNPFASPNTSVVPSPMISTVPDVSEAPEVVPTKVPSESVVPEDAVSDDIKDESKDKPSSWNTDKKTILKVVVVVLVGINVVVVLKYKKENKQIKKQLVYEEDDNLKNVQRNTEEIPISYKGRLIELGSDVLGQMRDFCIKDNKERTPREIVNIFVGSNPYCDKSILSHFLKDYESAVFFKIDVDCSMYNEFVKRCDVIYKILHKEKEEEGII